MMARRRLDLMQVADALGLPQTARKRRREAALRAVRAAERRHQETYIVRAGKEYMVSVDALESLLDPGDLSLTGLERSVSELSQKTRGLARQLNGHGARISNLEQWRRLTERYLGDCAALDAAGSPHNRRRRTG